MMPPPTVAEFNVIVLSEIVRREAAPWFPRYWDSTDARSVQLSVMLCLSMNACVILLGWMLSYIV